MVKLSFIFVWAAVLSTIALIETLRPRRFFGDIGEGLFAFRGLSISVSSLSVFFPLFLCVCVCVCVSVY